jgi:hypothetical protein
MRDMYALLLGASLSLAPAVSFASTHATSPTSTVQRQEAAPAPASAAPSSSARATSDDLARYAAKDESSPDAKNFRGGDTVVIGASAATAILAILLLVILL